MDLLFGLLHLVYCTSLNLSILRFRITLSIILHIETATDICSVALARDGVLIEEMHSNESRSHATQLTLLIEKVCKQSAIAYSQLNAIAVSKGPGSYTGLRIGVATAKGFCYALDKPLIGINTLQSFANTLLLQNENSINNLSSTDLLCPMIDARRMEVYAALFDPQKKKVRETKAEIITEQSFAEELKQHKIVFFGDGAAKCKELFQHQANAIFVDDFIPSASGQVELAYNAFEKKKFEDVAYFEPFYLKEFLGFKAL